MKFTCLLDQQQNDAGHARWLEAESVNSYTLIPAKYIDGKVILLLHFGDLRLAGRGWGGGGGGAGCGHRSHGSPDHPAGDIC